MGGLLLKWVNWGPDHIWPSPGGKPTSTWGRGHAISATITGPRLGKGCCILTTNCTPQPLEGLLSGHRNPFWGWGLWSSWRSMPWPPIRRVLGAEGAGLNVGVLPTHEKPMGALKPGASPTWCLSPIGCSDSCFSTPTGTQYHRIRL